MPKLTTSSVKSEPPGKSPRFVWDSDLKGFGVKIFPSGTKTFCYQYRTPEGRTRRYTLGKFGDALTVEQARKKAKDFSFDVFQGNDPASEKQARRKSLTLTEMLDLYMASAKFAANAETTQKVDRGRIARHLIPLVGNEFVNTLSPEQVAKMHTAIKEGKTAVRIKTTARGLAKVRGGEGAANKCVILLSAAYNWAIGQKLAKVNPCTGMKCSGTGTRETILDSAEEYGRLFAALQKMEDEKRIRSAAADAIRFIVLTGVRRGEATGLLWKWVNLKTGMITLPPKAHKGGHHTGKPRIIAMPAEAQVIVARQPQGDPDSFVFSPAKGEGQMALSGIWAKVRTEAKLPPTLGLHGLRHSIGTHLAMSGASAVELMEALGHKQISTTLRYIHFAERSRSTLAERAASVALEGLKKQADAPTPAPAPKLRVVK
ncbi:MAG: tyrosine-type recombinase/integrase [Pseudomonadota bacterium]